MYAEQSVATFLYFSNGMVSCNFILFHNITTLSNVVSYPNPLVLQLISPCIQAQYWGLSRRTTHVGIKQLFGILNSSANHVLSNHDHFVFTILTFIVFVPPNPFITMWQFFSDPTESSTLCDIYPEYLLSTSILNELVSNICSRSDPLSYLLCDIASLTSIY